MPNPYLKGAANQIRQAIAVKKQEVDQKRRQIDAQNKQTTQNIQNIKTHIRAAEAEMAQPPEKQSDPDVTRSHKLQVVLDKQKEIAGQERNLMLEKDRLQREIQDQEKDLMDLETQARNLEHKE